MTILHCALCKKLKYPCVGMLQDNKHLYNIQTAELLTVITLALCPKALRNCINIWSRAVFKYATIFGNFLLSEKIALLLLFGLLYFLHMGWLSKNIVLELTLHNIIGHPTIIYYLVALNYVVLRNIRYMEGCEKPEKNQSLPNPVSWGIDLVYMV